MTVTWAASGAGPALQMPCGELSFDQTKPGALDPRVMSKIGRALRDRVVEVYAEAGIGLPERRLWVIADAPYDCEELIVALSALREGDIPGMENQPKQPCQVPVVATFLVTVVRCIPQPSNQGTPPSTDALDAATDQLAIDAYLLMKAACRFDMFGADVEGLDPSALGGMGTEATVEAQPAQGGLQSVVLTLTTVIG